MFVKLSKSKYYSKLDLTNGFYQIPLHEKSRHITAFSTNRGQFQFKRLPFGICNGPSEFCRLMRKVVPNDFRCY